MIKTFAEKMGAMGYAGIVSVSIGARITEGGEGFETLYADADETLYFVKESGKNSYHFWSENAETGNAELKTIETDADLNDIHRMISMEQDKDKGAFHVEYEEFKKLYDFSMRCVARNGRNVQTLLFTLRTDGAASVSSLDDIMENLKQAVISTLRSSDTGTKYSCSQYIVLLMDTDAESGKTAAERVLDKFYGESRLSKSDVKVSYDIQSLASE